MADPTSLLTLIGQRWRAHWNRDYLAAELNGWTVERGRLGRLVVRDPRFDLIQECGDCRGAGIHGLHETPCPGCQQPCPTCQGHGTVRDRPLVDLPALATVLSSAIAGGGRRA